MATISRRKLAEYVAERLIGGESNTVVLNELAAYLIDEKRTRELGLIVRDIEGALAKRGVVVATATSARPLSSDSQADLERLIKDQFDDIRSVQLREKIDESVIGGVKLELPGSQLDATVATKLEKLTV